MYNGQQLVYAVSRNRYVVKISSGIANRRLLCGGISVCSGAGCLAGLICLVYYFGLDPQVMFRLTRRLLQRTSRVLRDDAAAPTANGLTLKFVSPSQVVADKSVYMVTLPTVQGDVGILSSHVPTIAQMRPGLVTINETEGGEAEKYFVAGGFAIMSTDSQLSLTVSEAFPVEDIDEAAVTDGLNNLTNELNSATDDKAKAEIQIGIDVYEGMKYALSMK
jgi:F-type H+-transporting ATPase subunit delta